jgi:excisionase family DNA binding protein
MNGETDPSAVGTHWLTPAQVAQLLCLSLSTVRAMIRDGRLPAWRVRGSRLLRIARPDVEGLLEPLSPQLVIGRR